MRKLYTIDFLLSYFDWVFGDTMEARYQCNYVYENAYGPNMRLMLRMKSNA